jgi:hypothetical protein
MSTVTAISSKPKATRKRLKKEILSDDFKKRKIFWKNIAENFLENFPYGKILYGKCSTSHQYSGLTAAMFKPLIFSVLGFALSYIANIGLT